MKFMRSVIQRFPEPGSIVRVYGLITFLVYSWAVAVLLWRTSSWVLYMTLGELLSAYAYGFLTAFVETVILITILTIVAVFLPATWLKEHFLARAGGFAFLFCASAMVVGYATREEYNSLLNIWMWWWGGAFVFSTFGLALVIYFSKAAEFVVNVAERTVIFLYIYIPLTAAGCFLVWIRNIS